jgi:hypothetical protein
MSSKKIKKKIEKFLTSVFAPKPREKGLCQTMLTEQQLWARMR